MFEIETLRISLAAARVNAGMTQEETANKLQVTKQTIINWEKGRVMPGVPEMEMLSRVYRIPIENIFLHNNLQKVENGQEKTEPAK